MTDHLPDPETTEAEAITVPTEDVLEKIDDDNPFKGAIEDLREQGESWREIWETLEDAYNPVERAAYEESYVVLPEYELRVVVYDDKSTSQERYETLTHSGATREQVIGWAEDKHEVIRVEGAEQIGTVKVG